MRKRSLEIRIVGDRESLRRALAETRQIDGETIAYWIRKCAAAEARVRELEAALGDHRPTEAQ